MIYWFIGQPGCGKTTIAKELKCELGLAGHKVVHFDGDDLRNIFGAKYRAPESYRKEQRIIETRKLQRLIAYIADQIDDVIVSTVNPYRDIREEFKKSRSDVIEIYVFNDKPHVRQSFAVANFEPPLENFIDVNTAGRSLQESYDIVWGKLLFCYEETIKKAGQ